MLSWGGSSGWNWIAYEDVNGWSISPVDDSRVIAKPAQLPTKACTALINGCFFRLVVWLPLPCSGSQNWKQPSAWMMMQDIGPFLNQNDPIQSLMLFGHKIPALIYSQGDFFQDGKSPLNHHLGYVIVLTFFQPAKNCKNTSIHGKLKKNERWNSWEAIQAVKTPPRVASENI